MSLSMTCTSCSSIMSFSDVAVGKDSEHLSATSRKVIGELERTETIRGKDQIWMDLYKILAEYSSENWDGEGALAISEKAIIEALRFINNLPTYVVGLPLPEITADNDGEISLEWYKNNREVFVVSISGKNRIAYAGLFGTNDTHGTEFFGESIPPIVLINLRRLFS